MLSFTNSVVFGIVIWRRAAPAPPPPPDTPSSGAGSAHACATCFGGGGGSIVQPSVASARFVPLACRMQSLNVAPTVRPPMVVVHPQSLP